MPYFLGNCGWVLGVSSWWKLTATGFPGTVNFPRIGIGGWWMVVGSHLYLRLFVFSPPKIHGFSVEKDWGIFKMEGFLFIVFGDFLNTTWIMRVRGEQLDTIHMLHWKTFFLWNTGCWNSFHPRTSLKKKKTNQKYHSVNCIETSPNL